MNRDKQVGPATRLLDGVWNIPLPFPSSLGHSHAYLVEGDNGFVLVDAGWNSSRTWETLLTGLETAQIGPDDIIGVAITHVHPDHYGLAARLKEHTGAWIAMHGLEAVRVLPDVDAMFEGMLDWLRSSGAPEQELDALRVDRDAIVRDLPRVRPDIILNDGDRVPGMPSLSAIHTPGHTPGHLCFVDESRRIIFTGDHVLPRITPNISQRPNHGEDPLGHFARSIAKLRGLGVDLVLPGHESPLADLDSRLDEITRHHRLRLEQTIDAIRDGSSTAWEVAAATPWSRPWASLQPVQRRSALGETLSHLERLVREGRLEQRHGDPVRWQLPGIPVRSSRLLAVQVD